MKYSIAVVSVFAVAAYAVPQGSADLLSQIPKCAQPCALNNIGASGCSLGDLAGLPACLCKSSGFQTKFADCAKSSCDAADQCTLYTNSVAQCKAANVPVTVPSPAAKCGGSGGPGPSSSAAGGGQETPAPSPSAPAASPPPAESTPAATEPAATAPAESTPAATGAPVATGNGTAPPAPTASAPSYSSGAGSLVLSGGAALFAAVLAVAAL
jgi:hypothetical protein